MTKNEAPVLSLPCVEYARAWAWLTRQGILSHRIDCHCDTCHYHIDRYHS